MSPGALKGIAIACFVLCAVLLFVAVERYQSNASNVHAINQMTQSSPLAPMIGGGQMEPGTPAATTYAALFAILAAAGGVTCLVLANRRGGGGPTVPPR